jgi:hypothetical protein
MSNRPDEQAMPRLKADMDHQKIRIGAVSSTGRDRSRDTLVDAVTDAGGDVIVDKPWTLRTSRPHAVQQSAVPVRHADDPITCPSGQVQSFDAGPAPRRA